MYRLYYYMKVLPKEDHLILSAAQILQNINNGLLMYLM